MNRILTGMPMIFIVCCSCIFFGCNKATSESRPTAVQGQTNDSKGYEKKYGPFDIGGSRIVVVNKIIYVDSENMENSFEIKNETGLSFYKESHINDSEGGTTLEGVYKLEGKSGEGLIIYFDTEPNAPHAGQSFQIFGMEKGRIKPLSSVIYLIGEVQPLQKGKSQGALRLFGDDLIKVEVWTDFFVVVVPLVVDLQKLTIAPLKTEGIFDINIVNKPQAPGTENQVNITFYHDRNKDSKVQLIRYEDVKTVEFINVFAGVRLKKEHGFPLEIDVSDLWLKVKINGHEGWVNDPDSFVTLGLPTAG